MKGFVGVTDNDWFTFLSQQREIDEVNFWQPHAGQPSELWPLVNLSFSSSIPL